MIPYVASRTHDNRMLSNLPDAIRNTKKSVVNTAELRQTFPLRENALRHVVEGDAATLVRWPPSVTGMRLFIHAEIKN